MFQNLSLWNGSTQLGYNHKHSCKARQMHFQFDLTVPKNGTVTLQVKGIGCFRIIRSCNLSSLGTYNFNGKDSGTAGTGQPVAGQQR